jgi:hypothetical protein
MIGGPREPQRRPRIARAPQAIRKENEHHRGQRVFFLPLCVVFKAYAIPSCSSLTRKGGNTRLAIEE